MAQYPWLRRVRHKQSCGQSAAVRSGVAAARSAIIVTLDGDGQNDPRFIPALLAALQTGAPRVGLIAGQRVGRKASGFKQLQSRIANAVRGAVLRDGTRDTGCGLKAFRRDLFLRLPYFDGLHRFLPALVKREGFDIGYVDVVDRPRGQGVSNYGLWDRLWVGILDLAGVWWLIRRRKRIPEIWRTKIKCWSISRTPSAAICTTCSSATWIGASSSATSRRRCSPCASWCSGSPPSARAEAWCRPRSGCSRSAAALMLLGYALYRRDPVFIIGQAFGVFVYLRNLQFVIRSGGQGAPA